MRKLALNTKCREEKKNIRSWPNLCRIRSWSWFFWAWKETTNCNICIACFLNFHWFLQRKASGSRSCLLWIWAENDWCFSGNCVCRRHKRVDYSWCSFSGCWGWGHWWCKTVKPHSCGRLTCICKMVPDFINRWRKKENPCFQVCFVGLVRFYIFTDKIYQVIPLKGWAVLSPQVNSHTCVFVWIP